MNKCIGCNQNINPEIDNEICNKCMGYCVEILASDICVCCGAKIKDTDKLYDICNECLEESEYVITKDLGIVSETDDYEACYPYYDDEEYEEVECGMCGELTDKDTIREGMCPCCFTQNVGIE